MKTLIVLVCVLGISTLSVAQDYSYPQLKPWVKYVFGSSGQMNIEKYPPATIDPWAPMTVNPAFMVNIDSPIALSYTSVKRMNPYHLFPQDYIDPGQSPIKREAINPAFINPHDNYGPVVPDPRAKKTINPAFQTWQD